MLPTLEEIRAALRGRNLRHFAKHCDVDYFTLCKIRNGKATKPSYDVIKRVVDCLNAGAFSELANDQ